MTTNIVEVFQTLTIIVGFIYAVRELRKGPSEAEARVTGSAVNLVDRLSTRLDEIEKELEELRADNEWLTDGVGILVQQLQDHGITPLWTPRNGRPKAEPVKKNRSRWGL